MRTETRRVNPRVVARVTVAPVTTTVRGLSTEIPVGPANGLDQACVVSCDNIVTVPKSALGPQTGYLLPAQEAALTAAIHAAFDLD
jgi:mRNA interferase MazF